MASSQGRVGRFLMMNTLFFGGLLFLIQLSYVLVYAITSLLSFMQFYLLKAPISLHFDNICQLVLLLSSLITVNYSPVIWWSFVLGLCLWDCGVARWGSASF